MNALGILKDIIGSLTTILISLVALGVVAGVVFGGSVPFVGGVLDNLLDLVMTLGDAGLVGLIVLAVLLDMYKS
jgi:hypothetical protein